MTINQRESARIETFLKAKIVLDDGLSKIDCVIRDLSDNGAKIEVAAAADAIPDKFTLEIPKKNRVHCAEIRWRYENRIGLRFLGGAEEDRINVDPGKIPLRADLIQENARLKALVQFLADRLRQLGQSVDPAMFDVSLPPHDRPEPIDEPTAVPLPRPGSHTPRARR